MKPPNLKYCMDPKVQIKAIYNSDFLKGIYLHKLIKKEVEQVDAKLASYLVPNCEVHGLCFEDKCCGRKPSATEIMNTYKNSKIIKEENDMYQTIVSREDMEKLFQNENNPEVQEKLRKLMEMKSVLE